MLVDEVENVGTSSGADDEECGNEHKIHRRKGYVIDNEVGVASQGGDGCEAQQRLYAGFKGLMGYKGRYKGELNIMRDREVRLEKGMVVGSRRAMYQESYPSTSPCPLSPKERGSLAIANMP